MPGFAATVNVFVPVAPRPGIRGAILVTRPLVLVAIPLLIEILFVAGPGTLTGTCACRVHRFGPPAQVVAQ
ncbi:MAG TPA: hypothetical protein VGH53_06350 [Streptosporangiaceae bacterium]